MGGRWSVEARMLNDKIWPVAWYGSSLLTFITKGIYCLIKYEVVCLGRHG